MFGRRVLPFLTLLAGFALGALTVWALRDDGSSSSQSGDGPVAAATMDGSSPRNGVAVAGPSKRSASRAGRVDPGVAADTAAGVTTDGVAKRVRERPGETAPAADAGGEAPRIAGERETSPSRGAETPVVAAGATDPAGTRASDPSAAAGAPVRAAPGVVVDAATQLPIVGARVLLAIADGPRAGSWWGDTSNSAGRFHPKIGDDTDLQGAHLELRVSKDGYVTSRTPASAEPVRIELQVRAAPQMPGRVVGVVRGEGGRVVTGEIDVDGYDDIGGNATQRTVADAQGAFVLEGVPPGRWQFSRGGGSQFGVDVPDGGEARIEIAPPRAVGQGGFIVTDVDPAAVKPADPTRAARLATLVELLAKLGPETAPSLDDGTRERLRRAVALEIQRLDAEERSALPRRAVTVTGLGAQIDRGARAWVRLEVKPRLFWRVEVQAGTARFPSVPIGTYTAVLVQPGRPEATWNVTVLPGDGLLVAEWGR